MTALSTGVLLACLTSGIPDVPEFGADLTVGQPAPPLLLDKLLQAPADTTVPSLQQGPAVVEFWATWCQPCVEQIPHFNSLQKAMEGRALRFLSITAEDQDKVTAFLATHPMQGIIGLEGKKTHNWGVRLLPTSVLLDSHGRVAAILPPSQLTPRLLQRLLNGEPLDADPPPDLGRNEDALLRTAMWRAADGDDEDFDLSAHHLRARRVPLKALVAFAYHVEPWQVLLGRGVEDAPYHVSVSVPADKTGDTVAQVARETLMHALNVRITKTQQTLPVVLLVHSRKPAVPLTKLPPVAGGAELAFHPGAPAMLMEALRPLVSAPLVDDSGLSSFELNLRDVRDLAVVRRDLQTQLALELRPTKKRVDVVRVEQR